MGLAPAKIIGSHFHIITLSGQMLLRPAITPGQARLGTRPLACTGAKQEAYYQESMKVTSISIVYREAGYSAFI